MMFRAGESGEERRESYRSTGVTHILRRISETLVADNEALVSGGGEESGTAFRFLVAGDRETRERAYRLAYRVYHDAGLAGDDAPGMVVAPYDATPQAFTLLAEDTAGHTVGTVSLALDSRSGGLPCDEIYGAELAGCRAAGRRLVEVTRLAIRGESPNSRMLLVRLFDFLSTFAWCYWGGSDLIIEVHPRHEAYYRRMLLFERIGGERDCPRVGGAPAVLMRLDLALQEREIGAVGGTHGQERSERRRTLYSHFCSLEQRAAVAEYLARQYAPMSEAEAVYFGLAETAAAVEVGGEPVLAAM